MPAKGKTESKSATDPRAGIPIELLTFGVSEFAAIRRVSRSTVYEDIAAGRLRTIKQGRRRLIPGSEVIRTAKEQAEIAA